MTRLLLGPVGAALPATAAIVGGAVEVGFVVGAAAFETVGLTSPASGAASTSGAIIAVLLIGLSAALLSTGNSDVGLGA